MIGPLPKESESGTRLGYSNASLVLLGLVIEAVSGKRYQQYVTDVTRVLVWLYVSS
ncbi:MAG: serine hydrolase [Bacillota bacterium]